MQTEKWDRRFLELAQLVGSWSKDPSTKVGAVIVDAAKRVRGIGFNGFARGIADANYLLENRNAKLDRIIHAEINAVLNSSKDVDGCMLLPSNLGRHLLLHSETYTPRPEAKRSPHPLPHPPHAHARAHTHTRPALVSS
jgi:hypothetical protein